MILIPRYKDLYIPQTISMGAAYKGEIKVTMRDENGKFQYETDWMPNLITNGGLDQVATGFGDIFTNCFVGSGSTAPAFTNTQLVSQLGTGGTTTGAPAFTYSIGAAPTYAITLTRGWRFVAGNGTGTIREIGFGSNITNPHLSLTVRALITPDIVKGASQIMDITHRELTYRDNIVTSGGGTDVTGVISIAGENYDYKIRAHEVTGIHGTAQGISGMADSPSSSAAGGATTFRTPVPYSNAVSGTFLGSGASWSTGAYTNGTYYQDWNMYWEVTDDNHVDGIRYICPRTSLATSSGQEYAINFARVSDGASIPKNADKTLYMTVRRHWRRYP